jgi:hypothetical protein
MLGRAGIIWFAIMLTAILNGAVRDMLLVPRFGDPVARRVSSLTLAALILLISWISLPWIKPASTADAWRIGVTWLAMTLAFEFGAGHYLFRTPWPALLADYNIFAGRLWILVLIATLTSPAIVFAAGRNSVRDVEISSPAADETPRP